MTTSSLDTLVSALLEAKRAIDDLWAAALAEGSGENAIKLSEASQGVHRALIAVGGPRVMAGSAR